MIAKAKLHRPTLTRNYGTVDFRNDLRKVFEKAGVAGQDVVFLLTDADIIQENFLEDVNCVLNGGEVPDLFDNDEMEGMIMNLRTAAMNEGVSETRADMLKFFHQVRFC